MTHPASRRRPPRLGQGAVTCRYDLSATAEWRPHAGVPIATLGETRSPANPDPVRDHTLTGTRPGSPNESRADVLPVLVQTSLGRSEAATALHPGSPSPSWRMLQIPRARASTDKRSLAGHPLRTHAWIATRPYSTACRVPLGPVADFTGSPTRYPVRRPTARVPQLRQFTARSYSDLGASSSPLYRRCAASHWARPTVACARGATVLGSVTGPRCGAMPCAQTRVAPNSALGRFLPGAANRCVRKRCSFGRGFHHHGRQGDPSRARGSPKRSPFLCRQARTASSAFHPEPCAPFPLSRKSAQSQRIGTTAASNPSGTPCSMSIRAKPSGSGEIALRSRKPASSVRLSP
jgi:hypothetical protein